jgi:hypothetical protein
MNFKKTALPLIFIFCILNLRFQCNRDYIGIPPKYTFKESVAITPYNLNYRVGDTVWLRVNIPEKKLFDEKTNTRVLFDSVNLSVRAQIDLLFNNPFISNGPFASFVLPTGISAYTYNGAGQTAANIIFGCTPSTDYNLLVGIVFTEKGVFGISFPNALLQKCFSSAYENSTLTFSLSVDDTHKQYYQQLPFSSIGKQQDPYILDKLDKKLIAVVNVQ